MVRDEREHEEQAWHGGVQVPTQGEPVERERTTKEMLLKCVMLNDENVIYIYAEPKIN